STCLTLATAALALLATVDEAVAAPQKVRVVSNVDGHKLQVEGRDIMVRGMNWDYFPIGTNYNYSLWTQPDDIIQAALDRDMPLLRDMGVNVIRLYNGIPPKWIEYIYDNYEIWTVLNHPMARYGYTLDGVWLPVTDYSNERLREAVTDEIVALVEEHRNTRGILFWLLGNENNYGLYWSSFEIEALPKGEQEGVRARFLYSLYEDVTKEIKKIDKNRPVSLCNGDLQFIDIIAEECPSVDIFATNVYRGRSAGNLYQEVEDKLGRPIVYAEFGHDAFNAKDMMEDQFSQADMLIDQWREIYEQSYGKGRVGNCIGGMTFQWVDGWWKYKQDERLDIHDTNASWPNGGYPSDFVEGQNNMNEEWWGITAKGPTDAKGLYQVYPRAAYYALQQAYELDPYAPATDLDEIRRHFGRIDAASAELAARSDKASLETAELKKVRVSGLRAEFETYSTGGERISTPEDEEIGSGVYPAFQGYDQAQQYWVDFEAKPAENITGSLSLSILGDVATNPIDELFYENRGRPFVDIGGGDFQDDFQRIKVYNSDIDWDDAWFKLHGFYRTGHFHWEYEGDFFGLYREANYGENLDIYGGEAPLGAEIEFKKMFRGFKLAIGPELWWGANPALLLKYQRKIGPFDAAAIYQEDLEESEGYVPGAGGVAGGTGRIPLPPTRKATVHLAATRGNFGLELGGIWSGDTKVGESFQIVEEQADGSLEVFEDDVRSSDTWGARAKLTWQKGKWNWYGQAAYMGLVADGGGTVQVPTFTGWALKETNSGNQSNLISGIAYNFGSWQIAPNVLYQKPLVDPIPPDAPAPARLRNIDDDPFAVRSNRERFGTEILIAYDPTPATWQWQWDSVFKEDAKLAWSLRFVHYHNLSTQDAAIAFLEDGATTFAFGASTPKRDLWDIHARILSRVNANTRIVAHLYGGTKEPLGDDPR
ncbi:MAG: glycosidase, partial [Gemmatimonadetes bacterium]|nr:glycosidase [Gemmatimonadota bacterium]